MMLVCMNIKKKIMIYESIYQISVVNELNHLGMGLISGTTIVMQINRERFYNTESVLEYCHKKGLGKKIGEIHIMSSTITDNKKKSYNYTHIVGNI